jgi:hypothetical protein
LTEGKEVNEKEVNHQAHPMDRTANWCSHVAGSLWPLFWESLKNRLFQIGYPNSIVSFFQPWGQIQGHKVRHFFKLVAWGRLKIFFLFQPRLLVESLAADFNFDAPILDVGLLTVAGVSCEASNQPAHLLAISYSPTPR